MKNLIFITIIFILAMLAGCSRKSDNMLLLDNADSIMEAKPDSALVLLRKIDTGSLDGDEEKARYALLLSMALDKNYIDVENDSLISIAERYYRMHNDGRERMLASFYKAKINYNAKRYGDAVKFAIYSMEESNNLKDCLWIARCNEIAADIYSTTYAYKKATDHRALAAELYKNVGKKINELYSKSDLALELTSLKHTDRSVSLIDSLINTACLEFPNDSLLQAHMLSVSLWIYSYSHFYEKALESLEKRMSYTSSIPLSQSDYIDAARIKLHYGQTDEAKRLTDMANGAAPTLHNSLNLIALNYSIQRGLNNEKAALAEADSFFNLIDNHIVSIASNAVLDARGDYHDDASKVLEEISSGKSGIIVQLTIGILCLFIIFLIFVFVINMIRKFEIRIRDKKLSNLRHSNTELTKDIDSIRLILNETTYANLHMHSCIEKLEHGIICITLQNYNLACENYSLVQGCVSLFNKISLITKDKNELVKKISDLKENFKALEREKEKLFEELQDKKSIIAKLNGDMKLLNENIQILITENESITRIRSELYNTIDDIKNNMSKMTDAMLKINENRFASYPTAGNNAQQPISNGMPINRKAFIDTFKSLIAVINSMCVQNATKSMMEKLIGPLRDDINSEKNTLRSPELANILISSIDIIHNGLLSRIKEAIPLLSEDNMKFIALVISGVSYRVIALVMDLKYDTISSKKIRIFNRIESANVQGWRDFISGENSFK